MDQGNEHLADLLATDLDAHFKQLVLAYQHRLYAFALRQTNSFQEAEDIVQEVFISAYYALAGYPPQRIRTLRLLSWLYKITLNIFYDRIRGSKLQMVSLDMSESGMALEIEGHDCEQPEVALEKTESLRELEALVATLPAKLREAVNLYYFEELSQREIAELLNQPLGTVKSNLHRGTRLLRKAREIQQKEVGYTCEQ